MFLLIDGYNLLHFSHVMGKSRGAKWLEKARQRLLQYLAESLPEELQARTVVVFDAGNRKGDLDSSSHFGAIHVIFASAHDQADDLIESLIRKHSHPKRLHVVSSDRRIQQCARAHRANVWGSDTWLDQLDRKNENSSFQDRGFQDRGRVEVPAAGITPYEVQLWLREFGIDSSTFVDSKSIEPVQALTQSSEPLADSSRRSELEKRSTEVSHEASKKQIPLVSEEEISEISEELLSRILGGVDRSQFKGKKLVNGKEQSKKRSVSKGVKKAASTTTGELVEPVKERRKPVSDKRKGVGNKTKSIGDGGVVTGGSVPLDRSGRLVSDPTKRRRAQRKLSDKENPFPDGYGEESGVEESN